jgi:hypothetical protein
MDPKTGSNVDKIAECGQNRRMWTKSPKKAEDLMRYPDKVFSFVEIENVRKKTS